MNMYIMILSIMYYFTNFGDLCDSGSFYLYAGSARHLETWNTPGYLFGIFQDLENLEK